MARSALGRLSSSVHGSPTGFVPVPLAALALGLVLVLLACAREPGPQTVHGLVVDVRAASFGQIASFELRADDGRSLSFAVEGDVGFTPSHLREHMVLAQPVTVTYHERQGVLVATHVED